MSPKSRRLDDASKQLAESLLCDEYARNLIRQKGHTLAKKFSSEFVGGIDPADVEQELLLQLASSTPNFNPERGHPRTFIKTVIERQSTSIERRLHAAKRRKTGVCSLSVLIPVEGEAPVELAATITQRELDARTGAAHRDDHDRAQLRADCAEVIASMDYGPRELARA